MFGFLRKRNETTVVGNVVGKVAEQSKYGLHTLYENTTLFLNNGAVVSPENIEVNRNHTNIEFCGQFHNSVDVLETNIANIFGHKLDIMCLDVFKTYFDSRFSSPCWYGAKEVNGEQFPIYNISWIGNLQSGTEVHFATKDNIVYKTEVYAIEFLSLNFIVFTTNATGTKRYFVFR